MSSGGRRIDAEMIISRFIGRPLVGVTKAAREERVNWAIFRY